MSVANSYSNYYNSFFSNDVNVLQKRQKQAKVFAATTMAAGAVGGAASLLSKKGGALGVVIPIVGMIMGASALNYSKQTEKKIAQLDMQG